MSVPSDIEIAQAAKLRPITDVAAEIGLGPDDLDLYGKYKAKVSLELTERPAKGKLVLVTAINPTPPAKARRPPRWASRRPSVSSARTPCSASASPRWARCSA